LIAMIVSMLLFATARSVTWLVVARLVQGLAIGTASTAASAALLELQPGLKARTRSIDRRDGAKLRPGVRQPDHRAVVDFGPAPTVSIYLALIATFTLALVVIARTPETACPAASSQTSGGRAKCPCRLSCVAGLPCCRSHRGHVGDRRLLSVAWPFPCRRAAAQPAPRDRRARGLSAHRSWLVRDTVSQRLVEPAGGLFRLGLHGARAVAGPLCDLNRIGAAVLCRLGRPRQRLGPSYMAGFRAIAALAPPQHKAEILATLFFVNYLFFSLPAIIAGLFASHYGLHTAALAFGIIMTCMGAIAGFGIYAADHASVVQPRAKVPEPCPRPAPSRIWSRAAADALAEPRTKQSAACPPCSPFLA